MRFEELTVSLDAAAADNCNALVHNPFAWDVEEIDLKQANDAAAADNCNALVHNPFTWDTEEDEA